jgi:hypothetical protein
VEDSSFTVSKSKYVNLDLQAVHETEGLMHELKLFLVRLLAAALLIAFWMTIGRAAGTELSDNLGTVGNHDIKNNAEVMTNARSRRVFARMDSYPFSIPGDKPGALYGSPLSLADVSVGKMQPPQTIGPSLNTMQQYGERIRQRD